MVILIPYYSGVRSVLVLFYYSVQPSHITERYIHSSSSCHGKTSKILSKHCFSASFFLPLALNFPHKDIWFFRECARARLNRFLIASSIPARTRNPVRFGRNSQTKPKPLSRSRYFISSFNLHFFPRLGHCLSSLTRSFLNAQSRVREEKAKVHHSWHLNHSPSTVFICAHH